MGVALGISRMCAENGRKIVAFEQKRYKVSDI